MSDSKYKRFTPERLILAIVSLVCVICLIAVSFYKPVAADGFWHLRMGLDLLQSGLSPRVDHYSFTHLGETVSSHYLPIFQVVLAGFVSVFDLFLGLSLFKATVFGLLAALLVFYFYKVRAPWWSIVVLFPMVAFFLLARNIVRPDIVTFVLAMLALLLYRSAQRRFDFTTLIPLWLLMLFWVNYHVPVFGFVIVAGLFLDRAADKGLCGNNTFSWPSWFVWATAFFVVGFLNRDLNHYMLNLIVGYLNFVGDWGTTIEGYAATLQVAGRNIPVNVFFVFSAVVVAGAAYHRQYGYLLILVVALYAAISMIRLLPMAALLVTCIAADLAGRTAWERLWGQMRTSVRNLVSVFLAAATVAAVGVTVYQAWSLRTEAEQAYNTRFPEDIVSYLADKGNGGNMLNEYVSGGYLIYHLAPNYKVYIDGRTSILYPRSFFSRYRNLGVVPGLLEQDTESYGIDYALLSLGNTQWNELLLRSGLYGVERVGRNFVLYSRTVHDFDGLFTLLLEPYCWRNELLAGTFVDELDAARGSLAEESSLAPIYRVVEAVRISGASGLNVTDTPEGEDSPQARRLAGYIALAAGELVKARELFAGLALRYDDDMDHLALAYLLTKQVRYGDAEQVVAYVSNRRLTASETGATLNLTPQIAVVLGQLVKLIEAAGKLDRIDGNMATALKGAAPFDVAPERVMQRACRLPL